MTEKTHFADLNTILQGFQEPFDLNGSVVGSAVEDTVEQRNLVGLDNRPAKKPSPGCRMKETLGN